MQSIYNRVGVCYVVYGEMNGYVKERKSGFECIGGGRCRGVGKVRMAGFGSGGIIMDSLMRPRDVVNSNIDDSILWFHVRWQLMWRNRQNAGTKK